MEESREKTEKELSAADDAKIIEGVEIFNTNKSGVQNALKLMDGEREGAFWVRYIFDSGTGVGWLQLAIQYPTGTVKNVLLCKNVCKETDYEKDGLGESRRWSTDRRSSGEWVNFIPYVQESMVYGRYDFLRKYERPDMPIPLEVIWQRIVENYAKIPIVETTVKSSLQEVYERLLDVAEDAAESNIYRYGKNSVYLTKDEVENIAEECGYTLQEIRTEFAVRGLWDCDTNSGGYQKTKKINGKNHRFYALKTSMHRQEIKKMSETISDTSYFAKPIPTQENKKIAEIQGELSQTKTELQKFKDIVRERTPDMSDEEFAKLFLG